MPRTGNKKNLTGGGHAVERNELGQIDTSRARMGRAAALEILGDPKYQKNLKERMVAGEGGAIEVWLWRIGYGDPQKDESENERQRERYEAIREEARAFLREHPEAAHVIDAQAMRAVRVLPRPQLVRPADDPA